MFTVKHIRSDKTTSVSSCDRFEYGDRAGEVGLYSRLSGWESLKLEPGDVVYVENLGGRTITTIRGGD